MKRCGNTRCPSPQPLAPTAFNRRSASPDGLQNYCKECQANSNRRNERAFRNINNHRVRRWRAENKDKFNAHVRVRYAVAQGLIDKQPCATCGSLKVEMFLTEPYDQYRRPWSSANIKWFCHGHHPRATGPRKVDHD